MKKKLSVLVWTLVRKIFGNTNRFRTVVYCATVVIAVCIGCNDGMGTAIALRDSGLMKEKHTITFDANGGTVTPTSGKTDADGKLASLPTPPPIAGYTFNGWFTADVGGTVVTTSFVFSAVTTIYAQWIEANNCTSAGACKSKLMPDGKVWMTENLKVATSSGSWCFDWDQCGNCYNGYEYEDTVSTCNKYGRLYDWETANTVCPSGWHLPSRAEWDQLAESVGGQQSFNYVTQHDWLYAGTNLKDSIGWCSGFSSDDYLTRGGTNEFGFSALPGGYRHDGGYFVEEDIRGYWWTATEDSDYRYAASRMMECYYERASKFVYEENHDKKRGLSVRCVRNAEGTGTDLVGGKYILSINTNPVGNGMVSRSPNKTYYTAGEEVTVTAVAATGYKFDVWSGVSTLTNARIVVIMNRDLMLTANFAQDTYSSTVMPDGKTWMTENRNVATPTGSWCYNDSVSNCNKYGRLYSWATAQTVCPEGWRLPSKEEWDALVKAAGGKQVAGTKLKSSIGWASSSSTPIGTDEYGFSALPGGYCSSNTYDPRHKSGCNGRTGYSGGWWEAKHHYVVNAGYRYMHYSSESVGDFSSDRTPSDDDESYAFSVRCVWDN